MNLYIDLKKECRELLKDERDFFANASNFCSLIYHRIGSLNWVGFYLLTKTPLQAQDDHQLVLGPYQGKPACIRIDIGKGVCGQCAELQQTILVPDVHKFPGHIACDSASNSEIVIPLIKNDKLYGVFDIDSPALDRFSANDKSELEELVGIFIESSDFEKIEKYYENNF